MDENFVIALPRGYYLSSDCVGGAGSHWSSILDPNDLLFVGGIPDFKILTIRPAHVLNAFYTQNFLFADAVAKAIDGAKVAKVYAMVLVDDAELIP